MEPAKIDWKTIDSVFVEEDLYENINAPKWVDFSAPEESVDDEAWFCRPDCKHPKSVEDFFKSTPTSLKRTCLGKVYEISPLGDRTKREATLKRRGLLPQSSISLNTDSKLNEDTENHNPNFSSTPNHQLNPMKSMIKSSSEKKNPDDNLTNPVQIDKVPKLKSTLSARNLFAGRDILHHITEFCTELKKMATRAKERENVEKENAKSVSDEELGDLSGREKERKPLLEVGKEKSEALEKNRGKEKLRRNKRADETENNPRPMDLKIIKSKEEEIMMQIRTNPPSPQCFSAVQGSKKPVITSTKAASKSRLMEKGIHQEVDHQSSNKEELMRNVSVAAEKEGKTLDMFWFLKPCTLSS